MGFKYDVFISYAHIDDQPLKEGEKGWINAFHYSLEIRLAQLMGEEPRIWRDPELRGNDYFSDEILEKLSNTAAMITILTPRYLKSEWCNKELREFYRLATEKGGVRVGNQARIFKVLKSEIPHDRHPEEIAELLGYEFYHTDAITGQVRELKQDMKEELENEYWDEFEKIACNIADLLGKLDPKRVVNTIKRKDETQLAVYLAETCAVVTKQQESIRGELTQLGFRVVPDRRLPFHIDQFETVVENYLDQSVLSVHLVGRGYGLVPEGTQKSVTLLQNELAVKKSRETGLPRLIWLHPTAAENAEDERQKQFIHEIRTKTEAQYGADMLETSIADFKYVLRDKLKRIKDEYFSKKTEDQNEYSGTQKLHRTQVPRGTIYLAETNYELTQKREKIKQWLLKRGYKVLPDRPLPLIYDQLPETIDQIMDQCEISIHLMGEEYGFVPDGTEKSLIKLQYERALEKNKQGKLSPLVRLSPTINRGDERQQKFIAGIRQMGESRGDIFETPLEEMETIIYKKIEHLEEEKRKTLEDETSANRPGTDGTEAGHESRQIYLICDRRDLENDDDLSKMADYLCDSSFNVFLPAFDGKEEDLMNDHRENLKDCDAAIIYYGLGNELWMRAKTRDLMKIAGYGRTRPLDVRAVFLASPFAAAKRHLRLPQWMVINGMDGFSPQTVAPLIKALKGKSN